MPLRRRLTITFTLGTAVVMALVSGLFLVTLRQGLTDNLDTTLLTRTSDVLIQLTTTPTTAVATESNDGTVVQILSRGGRVLDSADVLGNQPLLTPAQAAATTARPSGSDRIVELAATPTVADGGPATLRVVAVAGPDGTVVAAAARRDVVDAAVRRASAQLLVLSVLLVAAAAGGAWLLARAALRPVESMRRQAAALEPDDTSTLIDVPRSRDELARLAATFNDLLRRLRGAVEREQAFVADAGHELRTPLTVLRGELELAGRPGRTTADLRHTVGVASAQTEQLIQLAEDLLVLSRTGAQRQRNDEVDLLDLIGATIDGVGGWGHRHAVSLLGVVDVPPVVLGDAPSLRRAVDNIIGNAVRYTPPATTVDVTVTVVADDVVVTVHDHGPGFPPDLIPVAFGRFTRGEPIHRPNEPVGSLPHGAGLGLAIVDGIVRGHGGTAAVSNHPSGGAVVTLTLPRHPSTTAFDSQS